MKERLWQERRSLFWFLEEDARLDLSIPRHRDLVLTQVITRGATQDVVELLRSLSPEEFVESFERVKRFVLAPVRKFWEMYVRAYYRASATTAESAQ